MEVYDLGRTRAGEEVYLCAWEWLEPEAHRQGQWVRTFCPLHGSDHQRSLSIHAESGWGQCFSCGRRVLVRDFNPHMARILLQQAQKGVRSRPAGAMLHSDGLPIPRTPEHGPQRSAWQQEEQQLLSHLFACHALHLDRMAARSARGYLASRRIPLPVALAAGVGYLEPGASRRYGRVLRRWEDRLIFPLHMLNSPLTGYVGRLLSYWQRCANEGEHKRLLEARGLKRWTKSNPAGWFWLPQQLASTTPLIVVEGPFDRLAILADGIVPPQAVISLVGTTLQARMLPSIVPPLLLALDSDAAGQLASRRLAHQLAGKIESPVVLYQSSPHDGAGKDWSERWRRRGPMGLAGLYQQYAVLHHG